MRAFNALFFDPCGSRITLYFRWRCAWGEHPLTSRTRWLRLRRPTVLGWRRPGRIGGRQIFLFIEKKTIYSSFECSSYWTPEWLINSVNLRDQGVPWKLHTDRRIDKKTFWYLQIMSEPVREWDGDCNRRIDKYQDIRELTNRSKDQNTSFFKLMQRYASKRIRGQKQRANNAPGY